ncbi:sigma-B regulation protein RsbU (phosphoserine phosphatase) [Cognatiyoonia koreensis]|uniref:histidine kinase n=1 Tax=Cognatiyoonia koreensis TaxID=364200 RepID=A0A1I0RWP4_9RHOB|nr:PAS domain-containing sensor histidine kinase [Cognatiyoonia koreensis]SEW45811.1 sigma-B regulation protein RsbU (phosphoserine phosphatase) [Cognatiyoonia koreensis]
MLTNAPCGLLSVDHLGVILSANERLCEWLGKSATELHGTHLMHLFSKASRIVFETSIVPLLSLKGQVDGASIDLVTREGEKLPVLLSAEVSGAEENRVTSFAFLLAGARRAFEKDLAKARAEAETRLSSSQKEGELREQFIAILGHDLRNPLASIASAMNILSREPLSKKSERIVRLTNGSVRRMSLLIDNVLDFARNRLGGGIDLHISDEQSLENEIRQVVSELRAAHTDRDIKLRISNTDKVACDVPRVGQLLSNLLGNAITYGDPTQPIHVKAGLSGGNVFELSVRNFGPPISASAMERLFDPFVRSTNHEDREGLGLGLYIASEIAKAHGGSLDVTSEESHTEFTLRIPPG